MSRPTVSLDETSPIGSQDKSLGDDRIREFKKQVREIGGADHKYESGQNINMGRHNKVTLLVRTAPTQAASKIILYGKDVSDKCELFARDEDGDEVQITTGGLLNAMLLTGAQTITGVKTFSEGMVIPTQQPSSLADGMIWMV